jgi:regulatory protein
VNEEYKKAYSYALYLLDEKSYSAAKIKAKIAAKFSDQSAETVVSRLISEGYINDRKFASHAAEYMREVKKFGAYRIRQELYAKGIDRDIAKEVCAALQDDIDSIKSRIKKNYSSLIGSPAGEQKIQTAMSRYGFKFSDISKAIKELKDELITL